MIAYVLHFIEVIGAAQRVSAAVDQHRKPAAADLKTLNVSADAFAR